MASALSPSQFWIAKTTDALRCVCQWWVGGAVPGSTYHPMNLFRVNIAAMGRVLPKVPEKSLFSSFGAGIW